MVGISGCVVCPTFSLPLLFFFFFQCESGTSQAMPDDPSPFHILYTLYPVRVGIRTIEQGRGKGKTCCYATSTEYPPTYLHILAYTERVGENGRKKNTMIRSIYTHFPVCSCALGMWMMLPLGYLWNRRDCLTTYYGTKRTVYLKRKMSCSFCA